MTLQNYYQIKIHRFLVWSLIRACLSPQKHVKCLSCSCLCDTLRSVKAQSSCQTPSQMEKQTQQYEPCCSLMCSVSAYLLGVTNKELWLTIHHPSFLLNLTPFSLWAHLWWLNVGQDLELLDSFVGLVVSLPLWPSLSLTVASLPQSFLQMKGWERVEDTLHWVCVLFVAVSLFSAAIFIGLIMPSWSQNQWQIQMRVGLTLGSSWMSSGLTAMQGRCCFIEGE